MTTKNKNKSILWHRIGHIGQYESVGDDFDEIISVLKDSEIGHGVARRVGGISSSNYRGNNYISLYWGDENANLEKEITKDQLDKIKSAFSKGEDSGEIE